MKKGFFVVLPEVYLLETSKIPLLGIKLAVSLQRRQDSKDFEKHFPPCSENWTFADGPFLPKFCTPGIAVMSGRATAGEKRASIFKVENIVLREGEKLGVGTG